MVYMKPSIPYINFWTISLLHQLQPILFITINIFLSIDILNQSIRCNILGHIINMKHIIYNVIIIYIINKLGAKPNAVLTRHFGMY